MEFLPNLLAIAGLWLAAVITPGPNLLATVHFTLSRSRADGVMVVLGLVVGTSVWATAAAFGMAALPAEVGWLYTLLKFAGAAYLIYLGIKLLRSKGAAIPMGGGPAGQGGQSKFTAFRTGVLTNLSNPKTAVFFAGLYASLMPLAPPLWLQLASIAAILSISLGWYWGMAVLFSHRRVARRYQVARKIIDRTAGGLFVAVGVGLAASKNP